MPTSPRKYRPAHASRAQTEKQWASRRTEYRGWYQTPTWKRLSRLVKREEPLCRKCLSEDRLTPTQCIDHIVPHKGDWDKFTDRENLQGLCLSCHSSKTVTEDGGFGR